MFYCKKTTVNFRRLSQKETRESVSTINFLTDDFLKTVRSVDPNKAHEHDMISIRMIKIWDTSICRPIKLILQSCLEKGKFAIEWKKRV